jgi:Arc/MetJ-type ribon-helix-helix transcriptional regulator
MLPRENRIVRMRLDLCEWIEQQVKAGKFYNFSHGVEVALIKLRDLEKASTQV